VAEATAIGAGTGGCGTGAEDATDSRGKPGHVRRTAHPRRAAAAGRYRLLAQKRGSP